MGNAKKGYKAKLGRILLVFVLPLLLILIVWQGVVKSSVPTLLSSEASHHQQYTQIGNVAAQPRPVPIPAQRLAEQIPTQTATILVDDFAPQQPMQWKTFWPHNRLSGDRGPIGDEAPPGNTKVYWGKGVVTATITETNASVGAWTALNHPIADHSTIDFSAIFPSQIKPEFQGQITGLGVEVVTGTGTFQVEIKGYDASLSQEITLWSQSAPLIGGPSCTNTSHFCKQCNWFCLTMGHYSRLFSPSSLVCLEIVQIKQL